MRPHASVRVVIWLLITLGSAAGLGAQVEGRVIEREIEPREIREVRERFERLTPEQQTALRREFGLEPKPQPLRLRPLRESEIHPLAKRLTLKPYSAKPPNYSLFRETLRSGDWERIFDERQRLQPTEIKTAQALLKGLGFYKGSVDGVAGPKSAEAVQAFNAKEGKASIGKLDRPTLDALFLEALNQYEGLDPAVRPVVDAHTRELLGSVGFDQATQSLNATVRRYQRFHSLPETGRIGPELASRLASDLRLRGDAGSTSIAQLLGQTPELFLRHSDSEFFGFLTDGSRRYFLARPNAPELWALDSWGNVLSRLKGAEAIEEFNKEGRAIAAANSSDDLIFLHASPLSSGPDSPIALQLGTRAVNLPRSEFEAFVQSGEGLNQLEGLFGAASGTTGRRRAILVLQTGIFATAPSQAQIPGFIPLPPATAQAGALKAKFGNTVDVYLAGDARTARENATKLPSLAIKGPADITVYTARTVTDYDTIENLKKPLARSGIRVVDEKSGYAGTSSSNLIVVSGHRDRPLADHLNHLKDAGVLKGKLVAVISCYESGAESLQSDLLSGPMGAAGVLFFDTTVNAAAVESVLRELSKLIGSQGFAPSRLEELLERSVDQALVLADTPTEKVEIKKLRLGLLQLSLQSRGMASEISS